MSPSSGSESSTKLSKNKIFQGPNGLRAGWRLLIFFALFIPFAYGAGFIVDHAIGPNADRVCRSPLAIVANSY